MINNWGDKPLGELPLIGERLSKVDARLEYYSPNMVARLVGRVGISGIGERVADQLKLRKIHRKLADFAIQRPDAFFVQIGANDGRTNDQLHRHISQNAGWGGLVVEPIQQSFDELVRTYATRPNVIPVRKAIHEVEGAQTMFKISGIGSSEERLSLLSSFKKDVLLRTSSVVDNGLEPRLEAEAVDCVTLPHLLAEYDVENIDILEIDTEGLDAVVLGQFDLERYMPSFIIFEHYNISANERDSARGRLDAAGYSFIDMSIDTFCMRSH